MTRIAVAMAALAACTAAEPAAPRLRARMGPATNRPIKRVVALPATCGSLQRQIRLDGMRPDEPRAWEPTGCPPAALHRVNQTIRATFDVRSYEVIDAERVDAMTASRRETVDPSGGSVRTLATEGARFDDATPFEQDTILRELRIDAVLSTRVWIGAPIGRTVRRTVIVQVRMVMADDRSLVWARRCEMEVGLIEDSLAMERAARCVVEAVGSRPGGSS